MKLNIEHMPIGSEVVVVGGIGFSFKEKTVVVIGYDFAHTFDGAIIISNLEDDDGIGGFKSFHSSHVKSIVKRGSGLTHNDWVKRQVVKNPDVVHVTPEVQFRTLARKHYKLQDVYDTEKLIEFFDKLSLKKKVVYGDLYYPVVAITHKRKKLNSLMKRNKNRFLMTREAFNKLEAEMDAHYWSDLDDRSMTATHTCRNYFIFYKPYETTDNEFTGDEVSFTDGTSKKEILKKLKPLIQKQIGDIDFNAVYFDYVYNRAEFERSDMYNDATFFLVLRDKVTGKMLHHVGFADMIGFNTDAEYTDWNIRPYWDNFVEGKTIATYSESMSRCKRNCDINFSAIERCLVKEYNALDHQEHFGLSSVITSEFSHKDKNNALFADTYLIKIDGTPVAYASRPYPDFSKASDFFGGKEVGFEFPNIAANRRDSFYYFDSDFE